MDFSGLKRGGKNKYDSRVMIIAMEDTNESFDYFRYINENIDNYFPHTKFLVNIISLPTKDGKSSPDKVLDRLKQYVAQNPVEKDDLFFVCIDKDDWSDKLLKEVDANKDNRTTLMVSSPCFRTWICLHEHNSEQVISAVNSEKPKCQNLSSLCGALDFYSNKQKTFVGSESFNQSKVEKAISQSKAITNKRHAWPNTTGSHVYRFFDQLAAL